MADLLGFRSVGIRETVDFSSSLNWCSPLWLRDDFGATTVINVGVTLFISRLRGMVFVSKVGTLRIMCRCWRWVGSTEICFLSNTRLIRRSRELHGEQKDRRNRKNIRGNTNFGKSGLNACSVSARLEDAYDRGS